jgi:hypothetical protein
MREREIVVRIRLPRLPRKRWLYTGAAAVLLVAGVAYAAVTWPAAYSSGQLLSASDISDRFNDLDSRGWQGSGTTRYFNGSVGIGYATPSQLIDARTSLTAGINLKSTGTGSAYLTLDRSTASTSFSSQVSFVSGGNPEWNIGTAEGAGAGASDFGIYNYHVGSNAFAILNSNNSVGIGTTAPIAQLEVVGHVRTSAGSVARYGAEFWEINAVAPTSCNTQCGNGICIGVYVDQDTPVVKGACSDTTPNRNCICIGRP